MVRSWNYVLILVDINIVGYNSLSKRLVNIIIYV